MVLGKFPARGVLLIWIRVGQGPTSLAAGAGWGYLDIFSLVYHFSFSLSLGDGPIQTEILSQRAVQPKTTNQPNHLDIALEMKFSVPTSVIYRCH